jgi:hypothetical protein
VASWFFSRCRAPLELSSKDRWKDKNLIQRRRPALQGVIVDGVVVDGVVVDGVVAFAFRAPISGGDSQR